MMKYAWMLPVAAGALILGGCLGPEQTAGPQKNELTYGALSGLSWTQLPGTAKDIAASAAGRIWRIAAGSGDRAIEYYDRNSPNPTWTPSVSAGSGVRVEVEDDGTVWVVNSAGDVWRANVVGFGWTKFNHLMSGGGTVTMVDIGAGGGEVWALGGSFDATYGYQVYRLNRFTMTWELINAVLANRITVDNQGNARVVNLLGQVFLIQFGHGYALAATNAYGIGAGPDGQVWITDKNGSIFRWTGSSWDLCDNGLGVEIDRGNGFTLVTNSSNQIWIGTP